ncbi:MAG: response regulator transcription factor [Bacteroidia bacterium]|nr:response regulator transcription factor [Bacteroidia bacterium]
MPLNQINIALCDDHKLFREGMKSILQQNEGFDVIIEAENGKDLLDKLEDLKPQSPDIILLDLEMPELDGIATLPFLQEKHGDVHVIILSMHSDESLMAHLMEKGANGYVLKDADGDELKEAIEGTLNNGYFFSEDVSKAMLNQLVKKNKIKPAFKNNIQLTDRETEVLMLICKEMTTAEIAEKLFLSPRTVEGYRNRLLEKTGARNTAGLVLFASKSELLDSWGI